MTDAEAAESQRLTSRAAELGQRALASRGLRLERLPRPLLRHPERELRMHLDYAIAQRVGLSRDFFFVQIGAFDGRSADPLYGWVQAYRWRGLLVEPQSRYFAELVENYRGLDGLELRQVAVSDRRETRTLYTVADEPGVPHWAGLLASFDRETLLSHREFLPGLDELVRAEEVDCVPLNDLLAEAPTEHIDLLQIDVEGYDHELIRILDLERFSPSIVHFEHAHLTLAQHEASVERLIEHGYRVCLEEHDTLAYRPVEGSSALPEAAVEGPARLQAEHDRQLATAHEIHVAHVSDLERQLAEARSRAAERAPAQSDEGVACRFPLGHYYSPLPDSRELGREPRRAQVWAPTPRATPGIDWRPEAQRRLATEVLEPQERLRFARTQTPDPTEYWAENDQYPPLDAWVLEGLLRHLRPARMIEIGSGYSSLVTARVNRELLDGSMAFTCIEPYPREFLLEGVPGISELRVEQVQDTPLELFEQLGAGDVLFVDTSHTVKTGGDVAWIYGEVLPRVPPGVVVHIHDAFLPGEYPQSWVLEGWGWNEVYLIKAFLAFNEEFEVMFGVQWMLHNEPELIDRAFPGFESYRERLGGALWIRRREV
jgi:FkbM family methyltransferase